MFGTHHPFNTRRSVDGLQSKSMTNDDLSPSTNNSISPADEAASPVVTSTTSCCNCWLQRKMKSWYRSTTYFALSFIITILAFLVSYTLTVMTGSKSWIEDMKRFKVMFYLCCVFLFFELILLVDLCVRIMVFRIAFFWKRSYPHHSKSKLIMFIHSFQFARIFDCMFIVGDCILSAFCMVMLIKLIYNLPANKDSLMLTPKYGTWCEYTFADHKLSIKYCTIDFWFSMFGILLGARLIILLAKCPRMTVALHSMKTAFVSIVGTFLFLFVMLYICAVFTYIIYNPVFNSVKCSDVNIVGNVSAKDNFCRLKFGNVLRSTATIFQVVTGDAWISDIAKMSGEISVAFVGTISLGIFVIIFVIANIFLLNVITGIVVDAVLKTEQNQVIRRSLMNNNNLTPPAIALNDITLIDRNYQSNSQQQQLQLILQQLETIQQQLNQIAYNQQQQNGLYNSSA